MEKYQIISEDGLTLEGRLWKADNQKSVIVLVHGLGEHTGRYDHVAKVFNDSGYSFMGTDLRGHGESAGKRGHAMGYATIFSDLDKTLDYVDAQFSGTQIILYGHSMGGNIVSNYLIRQLNPTIKKAIITGPWLKLVNNPPAAVLNLARLLAKGFPSITVPNGLDTGDLSTDPQVKLKYQQDPLVHNKISLAFSTQLFAGGQKAINNASKIQIPILAMHGAEDRITSVEGTSRFAANCGDLCTLKIWPGMKHEIHNEIDKEFVFNFMLNWLGNSA